MTHISIVRKKNNIKTYLNINLKGIIYKREILQDRVKVNSRGSYPWNGGSSPSLAIKKKYLNEIYNKRRIINIYRRKDIRCNNI